MLFYMLAWCYHDISGHKEQIEITENRLEWLGDTLPTLINSKNSWHADDERLLIKVIKKYTKQIRIQHKILEENPEVYIPQLLHEYSLGVYENTSQQIEKILSNLPPIANERKTKINYFLEQSKVVNFKKLRAPQIECFNTVRKAFSKLSIEQHLFDLLKQEQITYLSFRNTFSDAIQNSYLIPENLLEFESKLNTLLKKWEFITNEIKKQAELSPKVSVICIELFTYCL